MITRFGERLASAGVDRLAAVDERIEAGFYALEEQRLRRLVICSDLVGQARMITREFLRHARLRPCDEVLDAGVVSAFCPRLLLDRGLRPSSARVYRSAVERFLTHLGSDGSLENPKSVLIEVDDAFRVASSRRLGREAMALRCSEMRSLLRGLVAQHVSS